MKFFLHFSKTNYLYYEKRTGIAARTVNSDDLKIIIKHDMPLLPKCARFWLEWIFIKTMSKNTRIFYRDETHLQAYEALSYSDLGELFLKMLKYEKGDELTPSDFSNPAVYSLFLMEKGNIDRNEEKWEKRAETNRENGQKGGRPRKTEQPQVSIPTCDIQADDLPTDIEEEPVTVTNEPQVESDFDEAIKRVVEAFYSSGGTQEYHQLKEETQKRFGYDLVAAAVKQAIVKA